MIGRVVFSHKRAVERPARSLPAQAQFHAGRRVGKHLAAESAVGVSCGTEGNGAGNFRKKTSAVRIVGIDGHDLVRSGDGGEKFFLGGKIVFHPVVVVEVILRQIGEHGSGKLHTGNSVLIQRMGGHFHNGRVDARPAHGGQTFVNFQTAGRGEGSRFFMSRPAIADRAENADSRTAGFPRMFQQIGAGRLAVRARYADDGEGQMFRAEICRSQPS